MLSEPWWHDEKGHGAAMVDVLIVDDSATARELLAHVLSADPGIRVVGTAADGEEALDAIRRLKPDAVTMDINMPKMNGFDATRAIMETQPTPIVIVSGRGDVKEVATTFLALEAGALAVVERPPGVTDPEHLSRALNLIETVKSMSEVKLVRRWSDVRRRATKPVPPPEQIDKRSAAASPAIVAIGASTGGPLTLKTILSALPGDFPLPILVVQHISAGFTEGFSDWLARTCDLRIRLAANGETLLPGNVYIAPDGMQMKIQNDRIRLTDDEPLNGLKPSVSYLFRSIAESYGPHAVGILLTGMGRDGAEELLLMRRKSAVTIAQDKESSVVHGMPGEAIELGGAMHVLPPGKIASTLIALAKGLKSNGKR